MTADGSDLGIAGPGVLPAPGAPARAVFGDRLGVAERFAELLAGDGVAHGHLGPREVSRIWDRHLVNCALVTDLLPIGSRAVDVGSGAGLPGLPMAIRRVDLAVDLIEPMARRVSFLCGAVELLDLGGAVRVHRGRADEAEVRRAVGPTDWVVARAVAPLDRLVRWCLPLLAPGGRLLALKGASAADEVERSMDAVRDAGGRSLEVIELGRDEGTDPTWVVSVQRGSGRGRNAARGSR